MDGPRAILTPLYGRAAFIHVHKPDTFGGNERFKMTLLFPKGEDLSELKTLAREAIAAKWGANAPAGLKSPFMDGDTHPCSGIDPTPKAVKYPVFANSIFIDVWTNTKPGIVDENCVIIDKPADFKAGDYCRCQVTCIGYSVGGNNTLVFHLGPIQRTRVGEALGSGGASNPMGVFNPVAGQGAGYPPPQGQSPPVAGQSSEPNNIPF